MKACIYYRNGRAVSYAFSNLKELKEIIDRHADSEEVIELSLVDYKDGQKISIYLPIK